MSAEDRKYTVGAVTFNNMFQVGMGAPLDNRDVVRRYAHLVSGIGENHYLGQVVYVTGEYDSSKDTDHPTVDDNNIVQSEVGYYYYKNDTEGWIKILLVQDGGSGGGSEIPVDVLPVGEPNGIAPLDGTTKIPSQYLPSYVDDVIEGYYYNDAFYEDSAHTTLITGETGKIYVDLSTDKTYRYSGSVYFEISNTQVSNNFTTNIAVGGIPVGTQITSSMSLEDVLKKILVNVYQPYRTADASATIAKTAGDGMVIEIGSKSKSYTFKTTGKRESVKRSNGTTDETLGAYAGAVTKHTLYHSGNSDTEIKSITTSDTEKTFTVTVDASGVFQIDNTNIQIGGANLTTSSEQIVKFKGGVTFDDGVQYNDSTGVPSTTLAAFDGQEKKSSGTQNVEVVCPIYANTNSAALGKTESQGAKSKSVLSSTADFSAKTPEQSTNIGLNISFPSHTSATPYTFEIPNGWTLRSVWWWDTGFNVWRCHYDGSTVNDWVLKAYTNGNDETVYYHDKEVNGVHVDYKTYYYTSPDNIGNRIYKVLISQ